MKLSVIIPVYNEEKTVREAVERVREVEIPGVEKEIIIVDDGSRDRTPEILKELKKEYPDIQLVFKERNEGKGSAVREGIKRVTGDLVIVQDADLEYDPRDYPLLMKPILEGKADVVYGSRFLGPHRVLLFWHMVGNICLNILTNLLYNTTLTDMETCYKMFRREVIQSIKLEGNGFDIEPEVTAKLLKRGYRIWEVPISYNGRGYEEGKKITWRDGVIALFTLLKYRFRD